MSKTSMVLDTIHLLKQKEQYEDVSIEDIETSISEAIPMLWYVSDIHIKDTPTHLTRSRDELIDLSIVLWSGIGDALITKLKNGKLQIINYER
jgi:hypothetical protein